MFYDFAGGRLFYKIRGQGTPLLILHGFAVDHAMMEAALEPAFSRRKVSWCRIYVDLPGMGESDPLPPERYADEASGLLGRLMEHLRPGEPYGLVSHSYGGYLSRRLVRDHPERLLGSFFVAPVIHPQKEDRRLPAFEKRRVLPRLEEQHPREYGQFAAMTPVESEYAMEMFLKVIHPALSRVNWENLRFYQKPGYSFSTGVDGAGPPFEGPSVFLLGRLDHIVGTRDALTLREDYPRADFLLLDEAGHNLPFEERAFFESALSRWLGRIARTG